MSSILSAAKYNLFQYLGIAVTAILAACIYDLYIAPLNIIVISLLAFLGTIIGLGWAVAYERPILRLNNSAQSQKRLSPDKKFRISYIAIAIMAAIALCWFNIPRTTAFKLSRSQFQALERISLVAPEIGTWIGPWKIRHAEVDPRGGLYIVTNEGSDFIDTISEGPVYNPNLIGSPFGNADYRLSHLADGWYWFHASSN